MFFHIVSILYERGLRCKVVYYPLCYPISQVSRKDVYRICREKILICNSTWPRSLASNMTKNSTHYPPPRKWKHQTQSTLDFSFIKGFSQNIPIEYNISSGVVRRSQTQTQTKVFKYKIFGRGEIVKTRPKRALDAEGKPYFKYFKY